MATRKKLLNNSDHLTVGGADLHRGDALAVLPTLAGPFGAVITDPPYSSGGQSKGDRARSTGAKYLNSGHVAAERMSFTNGKPRRQAKDRS